MNKKKYAKRKSKEDEERQRFLNIAFVIVLAFLLIITLGIFFRRERIKNYEEEKEKKRQRFTEVEARILYLKTRKDKIERQEKWILISARVFVSLLLVIVNLWYQKYFITPFIFPESLDDFLNINGVLLMIYAFVGFVFYGTVANLVQAMKSKLARVLRKNHLGSLEELEALEKEREVLKTELEEIDKNLTQLQTSNFSF